MRFGAREIQADIRGKAARRVAMYADHDLAVATHDDDFVGAAYVEAYPELSDVLGDLSVFLRWLVVDDAWRGRDHRGERVADTVLRQALNVARERGAVVAAGLVHVEHAAWHALLVRAGFIDITDLVERPNDRFLLMAVRMGSLTSFYEPPAVVNP